MPDSEKTPKWIERPAAAFLGFVRLLAWLGVASGTWGLIWGVATGNAALAAGGAAQALVASVVLALNRGAPRTDRWARLRAADPLRSDLRDQNDP